MQIYNYSVPRELIYYNVKQTLEKARHAESKICNLASFNCHSSNPVENIIQDGKTRTLYKKL